MLGQRGNLFWQAGRSAMPLHDIKGGQQMGHCAGSQVAPSLKLQISKFQDRLNVRGRGHVGYLTQLNTWAGGPDARRTQRISKL